MMPSPPTTTSASIPRSRAPSTRRRACSASVPAMATTSTPRRCNCETARSAACGALPCPDAGFVKTVTRATADVILLLACANSRDQLARVEDSRRIEHCLDRAQHLDAEIADLVAHPRPVVGADGVMMGDGGAGADHGVGSRGLGRAPLLDRVSAPAGAPAE